MAGHRPLWRRRAAPPLASVIVTRSVFGRQGYVATRSVAAAVPSWLLVAIAAFIGMVVPVLVGKVLTKRTAGRSSLPRKKRRGGDASTVLRVAKRLLWNSPHRRRAVAFMLLLFFALLLSNVAAVAQSFAQRDYMTALSQRDAGLFARGLSFALFLLAVGMPCRCLMELAAGGLGIAWRDSLTNSLLAEYFHPQAVYWLRREGKVPDPDMRIAVEAGHFSDAAVLMVRDIFENGLKLLGFVGVVCSVSVHLCWAMVGYALFGALATVYIFGRPLVDLDKGIRAQEASFRAALARCHDKAEALSFSYGEAAEGGAAMQRYRLLRQQQWSRIWWRTGLASFRDCFSWAAVLVPIALVAPLWLRGEVEFGVISQMVMAFQASLNALSVVVRKFRSVSSLIAEGARLEELAEALGHASSATRPHALPVSADSPGVDVEGLSLSLPTGAPLFTDLSFSLRRGQRLLIFGESGTGKTTLIRTLAGLWADGAGHVRRAPSSVFLSQEPYVPEGSLRRVLTFPAPDGSFSDTDVQAAARAANLHSVLARHELDAVVDWEAVLSRGEQQRCAFCRLLLLRPELAVLDEATSALDEENEAALYSALEAPCVISVSHRPSLRAMHTHVLRRENGLWTFESLE